MNSGLQALVTIAHFHQIPVNTKELIHEFGKSGDAFFDKDIILAAKHLSMKVKKTTLSLAKINEKLLPIIIKKQDGNYAILAKIKGSVESNNMTLLVHDVSSGSPEFISYDKFQSIFTNEVFLLARSNTIKSNLKEHFDISWFVPSIIKYKRIFRDVLIASLFIQIFGLITPLFFQVVMDKVLVHRGFSTLDVLAVGFFIIIFFETIIGGVRHYLFAHTANRIDVELGARLFRHLLSLPLSYFESRQVGQNVARVKELDTIRNFITSSALTLVIDVLFMFVFIIIMWSYSVQLTCIVLATLPCYVLLSFLITPVLRKRLNEKFKYSAANTSFLTETMHGIETVKTMAIEPNMRRKIEGHLSNYVHASFRSQNLNNIANQIALFINKLMTLGIIWFGAHLVIDGVISVGQLVAFNMLAGRVSAPILKLVQLWQDFQQAGISIKRLGDILNAPKEINPPNEQSSITSLKGLIQFDNVAFKYRVDGPSILHQINLTIKPKDVIGIVGASGSGKSTMTKLIQRLYTPASGRVTIDGVDVSMINSSDLRQQVGVVLQENFLFNCSIRDNIALRNPNTPLETIVHVAKLAGAYDFINDMPDGFNTLINENGSNLSGGQRQRIAIARALINNPKILIFDEATSALDYESERIIQDNMAQICHGRTVFIIAHRLSTVRVCNRILVMKSGRIVEEGSYNKLLTAGGYFSKLHDYQNQTATLNSAPHQSSEALEAS